MFLHLTVATSLSGWRPTTGNAWRPMFWFFIHWARGRDWGPRFPKKYLGGQPKMNSKFLNVHVHGWEEGKAQIKTMGWNTLVKPGDAALISLVQVALGLNVGMPCMHNHFERCFAPHVRTVGRIIALRHPKNCHSVWSNAYSLLESVATHVTVVTHRDGTTASSHQSANGFPTATMNKDNIQNG